MILILTMAGQYQRFKDAGFNIPKYLLPWGARTVLSKILSELITSGEIRLIFLVCNFRDEAFMPHVRAVMTELGVDRKNLLMVEDTKGQAETAMLGILEAVKIAANHAESVVVHNIDTILLRRDNAEVLKSLKLAHAYVDVFRANSHNYSYVLTDGDDTIIEIAEKIVLSTMATSGLYAFRDAKTFLDYYQSSDVFISDVLQRMISGDLRVVKGPVHAESDTIVLGTPAEYMNASLTSM